VIAVRDEPNQTGDPALVCSSRARRSAISVFRSRIHPPSRSAMRLRAYLRNHGNIAKRLLVHLAGFNLGLLMRTLFGVGKPRPLPGLRVGIAALMAVLTLLLKVVDWSGLSLNGRPSPPTSPHVPLVRW
jgi:hypothetical protein